MQNYLKYFFYALLLSPLISYFTSSYAGVPSDIIFKNLTLVIGIAWILMYLKKIQIPFYLYIFLFYTIYIITWDTLNGTIASKGVLLYIMNDPAAEQRGILKNY